MTRSGRIGLGGAALLLIAGVTAVCYFRGAPPPSQKLLDQARRQLAQRNYARAEELARAVLDRTPRDTWALTVAAEAAVHRQRSEAALDYYLSAPDDCSPGAVACQFGAGEVYIHQGKLSLGEQKLRRALGCDPEHLHSHFRLSFVLAITGRRWESIPHLLALIRAGRFSDQHLVMLGDVERVLNEPDLLEACRKAAPDDPLAILGEARMALARNELIQARRLLERVVAVLPGEPEAQARLGVVYLESGLREEFFKWNAILPPAVDAHPDIWVVRGRAALEGNEPESAARCFWEAVLRDPDHRLANYRLGSLLTSLGESTRAAPFLKRAERLQQLSAIVDGLFRNGEDCELMSRASLATESLARIWEAWGWARTALGQDESLVWAKETVARLEPHLRPDLPRTLPEHNPAQIVDLSSFPLPSWSKATHPTMAQVGPNLSTARIQFEDVATSAGIEFVFFNSPDPDTEGARIVETTGGGLAAFDFDGDAWPDLYFTQGCRLPPESDRGDFRDRLFRNLGDGSARDVTGAAGLGDGRYGQGVAAADFDNDGFADLYLANLGLNRLYRNNGDGTFADFTRSAGISGRCWTTSCLIADLNGDTWPDIYDVTYCSEDKIYELLCGGQGIMRSCSPRAFDAAPDRVWLSNGDGTFADVTATSGIDVLNGFGLGIVAADFEGTGKLNLFIANDEVANFYFANQTGPDGKLKFEERALTAGLAFDADGLAQACMGVAAGDADGNGLIDLYVANFYNESDTLYLQEPAGMFTDATRAAGLREPTFAPLSFGTQFLDADLDGLPDLVVTTGHVDDLTKLGQPYEMSPQFFQNVGRGRFRELPAESLGPFFEGKYLGRGLARLDWDRDGKDDFAISHIGSPAALVVNRTQGAGHFLALHLRAVKGARDAIGTTVRVEAGGRDWTGQLTAGDGYQATNQRRLTFGLGDASRVERLAVHWLSGTEQTFESVPVDAELLLIEGRNELMPFRAE